jgi:hypothetical protein
MAVLQRLHHAHWLILGDMADVGTSKPEHAYFLVPAGDYRKRISARRQADWAEQPLPSDETAASPDADGHSARTFGTI